MDPLYISILLFLGLTLVAFFCLYVMAVSFEAWIKDLIKRTK